MRKLACVMAAVALVVCVACGDSQDDSSISAAVRAKLAANQAAGTSQVNVDSKNQVVTLSGPVDTPAARELAIRLTRETQGVRDVVDNIQVKTAATAEASAPAGQSVGDSASKAAKATGDAAKATGEAAADTAKATGNVVTEEAKTTGNVVTEGAKSTGDAIAGGAKATGTAVVKGTETAVKATGDAAVKGAEATASGAKKLGSGIVGAVTPDKEKK
jgi:hypothetical protein